MGYITSERIPTNLPGITSKGAIAMAEINEAEVMDALHECYDPEIPVNIVDLGLIYNVDINDDTGQVDVKMTLTAMGCPMAGGVIREVEMWGGGGEKVKFLQGEVSFDSPLSTHKITQNVKRELSNV